MLTTALDFWLSDIIGYPVYNSLTPPESDERSLTCAKVPVADIATVHEWTDLGFRVVDVNVHLTRAPGLTFEISSHQWTARPEHQATLLKIAGSCFNSRFHLDPCIQQEDADRVKREWLRSHLEGRRGIDVLTALDGGTPVGFLAVTQECGERTIDLLGVDEAFWGKGVGASLVAAFVAPHRAYPLTF